jgi:hypothetical protein
MTYPKPSESMNRVIRMKATLARRTPETWGVLIRLAVLSPRTYVLFYHLLGPKRFTDLRAGLPHVSPNVLGQRLRELEGDGVLRRRKLGPPAGTWVYELTDWGQQLEPVLTHLGPWGLRSPAFGGGSVGVDSLMLARRGGESRRRQVRGPVVRGAAATASTLLVR